MGQPIRELELMDRVARKLWGLVACEAEINPTTEGKPVTYDDGGIPYRALCRTLATIAIEEVRRSDDGT